MNLNLIYSTATGKTRTEVVALSSNQFSIGGLSEHDLSVPGATAIDISCDVRGAAIELVSNQPVKLDKVAIAEGSWLAGQRLEFGGHCLTLQSLSETDIVIDVSLFSSAEFIQKINPFKHGNEISLGKRKTTYILLLLVLCLGFLAPLGYHFFIKAGGTADNWHGPTDAYWTSGSLVNAHQNRDIDGNCQACHSDLWVQAQDENCLACHHEVNAHAQYNPHENIGLKAPRCASCHKEHSGELGIINYNSAGCISCHKEPGQWSKNEQQVRPVTNFDATHHPEFRLTMLKQSEQGWHERRVAFSDELEEQSNLKFSHQLHLNGNKVNRNDAALECADCHVLQPDKEHFVPVTMEADCIDCHTLGIDIEEVERQLPHGSPRQVIQVLEEFMSYQYINPQFRKNRQQINVRTRAIPGKPMIRSSFKVDPCTSLDSVYECVADEVEELATVQFERAGCITCHEVSRTDSESLYDQWQIAEVRLQDDWYAAQTFDHFVHLSGDYKSNSGACLSCHAATVADTASVVLIPEQNSCLNCHVQGDSKSVDLSCLNCHMFHRPQQPPMSSNAAGWQ